MKEHLPYVVTGVLHAQLDQKVAVHGVEVNTLPAMSNAIIGAKPAVYVKWNPTQDKRNGNHTLLCVHKSVAEVETVAQTVWHELMASSHVIKRALDLRRFDVTMVTAVEQVNDIEGDTVPLWCIRVIAVWESN